MVFFQALVLGSLMVIIINAYRPQKPTIIYMTTPVEDPLHQTSGCLPLVVVAGFVLLLSVALSQ